MTALRRTATRLAIGIGLNLGVAALHVLHIGAMLGPELRRWHSSYFSDLAIPFAFYFLLCFVDDQAPWLRSSGAKALTVFAGATGAELCQGAGIPLLGRTFDPWDIVMYAVGVSLAALVDAQVLSRWVRQWPLAVGD